MAMNAAPGEGRLSGGMLIEASILARLLRLRLLTVDASVLLLPANPTATAPSGDPARELRYPAEPRRQLTSNGDRESGLTDAIRTLDEGTEFLAEARRNRSVLERRELDR
jgi:hypothetical protein